MPIRNDFTKDSFELNIVQNITEIFNENNFESILSVKTQINNDSIVLPEVQTINIDSLKKNNRENSFLKKSISSVLGTLDIADNAFLNSILSNCIYTDNLWTLTDIDKDISSMLPQVEQALKSTDQLYKLKLWHFNKYFFTKILTEDINLEHESSFSTSYGKNITYRFQDGHYNAFDGLAHAAIVKSKLPNEDGYVLHVVFRGTEFSKLPAYLLNAYIDMEAYFEAFTPFNDAVQEYINDPGNNIKQVHVTGHSLGGAMVQKFLQLYEENSEIPIHGYTFGSPGSKKHLLTKFLNLGYHIIRNQTFYWETNDPKDERLHEFYNSNDPIPKIGLLGYQRTGIIHNVFDEVYEESKNANLENKTFLEKIPMFGGIITFFNEKYFNKCKVRFHNSKLYTLNIKELIENHYETYPNLVDNMKKTTYYFRQYCHIESQFKQLSIKYKSAFTDLYQHYYPNLTKEEISQRILQIREDITYEHLGKVKLSQKTQISKPLPLSIGVLTNKVIEVVYDKVGINKRY